MSVATPRYCAKALVGASHLLARWYRFAKYRDRGRVEEASRRMVMRRVGDTQVYFTATKIYFPRYVVRGVFATFARLIAAFGPIFAI